METFSYSAGTDSEKKWIFDFLVTMHTTYICDVDFFFLPKPFLSSFVSKNPYHKIWIKKRVVIKFSNSNFKISGKAT